MSASVPLTLYGHLVGPNPWKVSMILDELNVPYKTSYIDMSDLTNEPYVSINPNARLPAIHDPNTGITLWESGAIIEYLIETYDQNHKLSLSSFPEKHHLKQWLFFQVSGQGPYFGQLGWFKLFHHEDVPSAKKRYEEQTVRVFSVLDRALKGKDYLVGDKCTYADISFVTWNSVAQFFLGDAWNDVYQVDAKYPDFVAWMKRLEERPVVAAQLKSIQHNRDKQQL